MSTLVLGAEPVVEAWLEQRRALGQDKRDEVWEGVYHVAPHEHGRNGAVASDLQALLYAPARAAGLRPGGSFNLGMNKHDFRVPDLGFHRGPADMLYFPTAALVIEVLSPDDETFAKFDFYARHDVDELWVVDPLQHSVRCWTRRALTYDEVDHSELLGLPAAKVESSVDWP